MVNPIQAVRGMNDVLPEASPHWEFLEDAVREVFRCYGYRNLRTPLVEPTPLFARAIGAVTDIVEKEMYTFTDLNGDSLTLRPEATAGVVRAAIQHNLLYNGPQRIWTAGPMFRHERPQKGRTRQFHQFDAEALGFAGPDVDAEQLVMLARLWRSLGLDGIELQINSIGDAAERHAYRAELIAYFERHPSALDADAARRLHANPLRILDSKNPALADVIGGAPKLIDTLGAVSRAHFEALQELLREAGVPSTVNPRLVRGLDYYNRTVFEWVTDRLGAQGTVCAGGRYDGLIEQLGGKPAPAVGFALGVERVVLLLEQNAAASAAGADAEVNVYVDVYVVHHGESAGAFARSTAETLRDAGLRAILHAGGGAFKAQMKRADASGARYAVIVGDDEAAAGMVSVKALRAEHAQLKLTVAEAIALIKKG